MTGDYLSERRQMRVWEVIQKLREYKCKTDGHQNPQWFPHEETKYISPDYELGFCTFCIMPISRPLKLE
jgi:hypothetical protein